ncbi:MAG: putative Ig domain-containing protein [Bdellovibrionales bacterium]|nr:putative Ig domain-containing protein [Bdellovibrionales bacterium]
MVVTPRSLKVRYFLFYLAFLTTAIAPALADERPLFSTSFSSGQIRGLEQAADAFRERGVRQRVSLQLPTEVGAVTAFLEPHDIRSERYQATKVTAQGVITDPVSVRLFRGAKEGANGEFFRFALIEDPAGGKKYLRGHFSRGGKYYQLTPSSFSGLDYTITTLRDDEFNAQLARCGVGAEHLHSHGRSLRQRQTALPVGTAVAKVAEIATEADFEMFQQTGSATNATILTILNAAEAFYAPFELTFQVTRQNVWTVSNDPYTSSDAEVLLDQFVEYWNDNFANTVTYDLAHLWTGREVDGSTIGIAYLGTVCGFFRYGLSQYLNSESGDPRLVAHEIGHNFDADHDTTGCNGAGFIMCPSLQPNAPAFSQGSQNQINAFLQTISCLAQGGGGGGGSNSPPVLSPIGPKTVAEGTTLSFAVSATDTDDTSLSYVVQGAPDGATFELGTFSYTPAVGTIPAGESSTAFNVTFRVSDGEATDSETVTITVTPAGSGGGGGGANNAPTITNPGTKTVAEGQLLSFTVQATDSDGDTLTYSITSLPAGAVFGASTGSFSWVPSGSQSGSYSLTVTVRDPAGASSSSTFTINVQNATGVDPHPDSHTLMDFNGNGAAELVVYRNPTGEWFSDDAAGLDPSGFASLQFGLPRDLPVPGDYDGDNRTDFAVFRPSTSLWFIRNSNTGVLTTQAFGLASDVPVPGGDYDGDGRADVAVFRTGIFIYRASSTNADVVVSLGQAGDVPVPCNYSGDDASEPAVYRPSTGQWITASETVVLGTLGDIPMPGDYDADGLCERAVWRPSTGEWIFESGNPIQFGLGGDVPVAADYDGDGRVDIAVFRPSEARWYIRDTEGSASAYQLGLPSDLLPVAEARYVGLRSAGIGPLARSAETGSVQLYSSGLQTLFTAGISSLSSVAIAAAAGTQVVRGDYDGDAQIDTAVFNGGFWTVLLASGGQESHLWGAAGDVAVSVDFDGDGTSDIAVFRPDNGNGFSAWYAIRSSDGLATVFNWGLAGDTPIPADFNGDGWTDPAVWRAGLGLWFVLDGRSGSPLQVVQWGLFGDVPRVADFDGDGRADKLVWRPLDGTWYVLHSGGSQAAVQWGLAGDVPVPGRYLDGQTVDYAVYRPATGTLFVLSQAGSVVPRETGVAGAQVVGVNPTVQLQ